MFTILVSRKAEEAQEKMPKKDRDRVQEAIDQLAINPFAGKKLDGECSGYWSFRVWPYRIIYSIDKKIITVTIVSIGHRKDVYRKLRG